MVKNEEFTNVKYFENRELSWIKFDERILGEAKRQNYPSF